MRYRALVPIVWAFSILLSSDITYAWQQNYPDGPVRSTPGSTLQYVKVITPGHSSAVNNATYPQLSLADTFQRRVVTYPSQEGGDLGTGWDFILNNKKFASCIQFGVREDTKYQNADAHIQESSDEETLDFSLNAQFSGSVGGVIEGIKAKADATSTLNVSHHIASKDTVFVAHVSVTNGVTYVGAPDGNPKSSSVRLTDDMAQLAATNPAQFNEKCGDGFVASIGYGADLYLLFHFHDLEEKDRLELAFLSHASAGIGDVFNASGSSDLRTKIEKMYESKKLNIDFVQRGGEIEAIPTTLDEARTKVQNLAKEELKGPRAFYITIVPYSELANWPGLFQLDTSDIRQRAIRFYKRLVSINFELQNIRENYYRDRSADYTVADQYYYSYKHNLRNESLSAVADKVIVDLSKVSELLKLLDDPECNPPLVSAHVLRSPADADYAAAARAYAARVSSFATLAGKCTADIDNRVKDLDYFDDFELVTGLPIPINEISPQSIKSIEAKAPNDSLAETEYAQAVFRHWVERPDQIRCRLYLECLTPSEKQTLYNGIVNSMGYSGELPLVLKQCNGSPSLSMTVAKEFAVAISDAHTDTMPSLYSLTRTDAAGTSEIVIKDQLVDGPVLRAVIESHPGQFDIEAKAEECGNQNTCVQKAMIGVCFQVDRLNAKFWFFDSGEVQAIHHNIEVNVNLIPTPLFP